MSDLTTPKYDITYCKVNVISIYEQYQKAHTYGKGGNPSLVLENLKENYPLIKSRQNSISAFRNLTKANDAKAWEIIKEDLFREMIRMLSDYDRLDLKDNRLLLKEIKGYFHHTLREQLANQEYELKSLCGKYRCFQPSSDFDDMMMIGECNITYNQLGQSLDISMEQRFTPHQSAQRVHKFEGTIVQITREDCIWIDREKNDNMTRIIKIKIAQTISTDQKPKGDVISMNGWCYYNYEGRQLARRFFLEKVVDDCEIKPEYYNLDSKLIPDRLRPYLNNSADNVKELESI